MNRQDRIRLAGEAHYQCAGECGMESYDFSVFEPDALYWDEGAPGREAGWLCEMCLDDVMLRPDGRETLADAMNETGP